MAGRLDSLTLSWTFVVFDKSTPDYFIAALRYARVRYCVSLYAAAGRFVPIGKPPFC